MIKSILDIFKFLSGAKYNRKLFIYVEYKFNKTIRKK